MNIIEAKLQNGRYLTSQNIESHFAKQEMMCHCGCREYRMSQNTIDCLEKYRLKINMPIIISRGVSCEKHNKEIGGASKSEHLPISEASDINTLTMSEEEMFDIGLNYFRRIGLYCVRGNLHVDTKDETLYWFRRMKKTTDNKGNEIWISDKYEYYKDPLKCLEDYRNFKVEIISNGFVY
jgi:hypothetical protein